MSYGSDSGGAGPVLFLAATLVAALGAGYWYSGGGKSFDSAPSGGPGVCSSCKGSGRATCGSCGGLGKVNYIDLSGKNEGGIKTCRTCGGTNKVMCRPCSGNGKIFAKK